MVKINCKNCGRVNISYSPPRFCQHCHAVFQRVNEQTEIKQPVIKQEKIKPPRTKHEQAKKPAPVIEQVKPVSYKKPLTEKQKKYYQTLSDTMQRVKNEQTRHITDRIYQGYMSISEFMADPGSYMDSRIMGKFIKNSVMRKQIIKAVEAHVYGALL